ncbi:MAG: amino acid adenylation domain-containing protein [Hamadaea sp.]|uniref:non-ribosomal peptide synthetase n=1 Tax=Hamadaea sp. TaxID=2024425 RepID=UPI00182A5C38|nr:non-ribosomal peptide synthetase [Hamadaea sp.]NUR70876.1 amino acid adenylation domain-containing protein [Hamadaea sp.]NUT20869.1 amino acid adenylation domain-containing protein [Hamadaea sp.]
MNDSSQPATVDPAAELRRRLVRQRLAGQGTRRVPPSPAEPASDGPIPLSSAQRRMWFLEQLNPGGTEYLVPLVLRLRGSLDVPALTRALTGLIARHQILRTGYELRDGEPVAVVAPPTAVDLPVLATDEVGLSALLDRESRRGFDLARGQVWRATLVRLGDDEHVLVMHIHHIACDGWSTDLLCADLASIYRAARTGLPSPRSAAAQYGDHARAEQRFLASDEAKAGLDWWRDNLADLDELELPTDRPRSVPRDPTGSRVLFTVPAAVARGVAEIAQAHRTTAFVVLLAGYGTLLSRLTRQTDIAVGSPVSGRTRPGAAEVVGPFINTVVLRIDCAGDPSFAELIGRVRHVVRDAMIHQDIPFDRVVDAVQPDRDLSRNPLVSALLLIEEDGLATKPEFGDLDLVDEPVAPSSVKLDLSLGLRRGPDGELHGAVDYATALFDRVTMQALADRFVRLLQHAIHEPELPVTRLCWLSDAEHTSLMRQSTGVSQAVRDATLPEIIGEHAGSDAIAVRADGVDLSYRDLDRRSEELAKLLAGLGVRRGDVVGACLPRSLELVWTLLAILKAGAAYLPLDPDDPANRLQAVVGQAGAGVVVAWPDAAGKFEGGPRIVSPDGAGPTDVCLPPTGPLDLAYVIFTSGSTGTPKGVMIDHAGIVNRLDWMQRAYQLRPGDRVLQKTPYTFDVSVWEFFWPLMYRATLVMAAPGEHRDLARLDATIRREQISHLHFVPSVLDAYLDTVPDAPPSLRQVYCSGEALRAVTARRFAAWSTARLHNLYGPTEASVDVTAFQVDPAELAGLTSPSVPIGAPISNMAVYVLDQQLSPVPVGCPGELYLAGVGLARGYLRRPEITAQRFLPDPFAAEPGRRMYRTGDLVRWRRDGTIEFLGRIDNQVKLHGVRIELGEIEAGLAGHPRIAAAAVVVHRSASGPAQLVAYVVSRRDTEVTAAELRSHLAGLLPAAMVPARYVFLPELPLTRSGKLDKRALPAPSSGREIDGEYVAPRNADQAVMVSVWSQVLGVDRVGADDDFFALGGDSMRAIRLVGALKERGVGITVQDVFQHRTPAALSAVATSAGAMAPESAAEPFSQISAADRARLPDGVVDAYPVTQVQAGMLYEMMSDAERLPYQNFTLYFIDDGAPLSEAALRGAVREVVRRHEVLRTSFDLVNYGEPLQLVHADREVQIFVEDLTGLTDAEQTRHIRQATQQQRLQPMDIGEAPLWRLYAYRTSAARWTLAWMECHVILDGWSHNSLLREVMDRYTALRTDEPSAPLTPPVRRWADFVAAERDAIADQTSRDYWAGVLAQAQTLRLPTEWAGQAGPAHTVMQPIGADAVAIRDLATAVGVPVKSVFFAAFLKVLSAITVQDRFLCGLVCNGRPEISGGDQVLGMYLNTVPVPGSRPDGTWRELIHAAAAAETALLPHRRFALPAMRALAGTTEPLVEAVFNFLDFYLLDGSGVEVTQTDDDSPNEFPLEITVLPGVVAFTALGERIRPQRLAWLAEAYNRVLRQMLADVDGDAGGTILAPPELAHLLTSAAASAQIPPTMLPRPVVEHASENLRAYVLDPQLTPVPVGVPGELYLGGVGVADPYAASAAATAEECVPDPFGTPGGRLLRTGERVRWLDGDVLEAVSPIDDQLRAAGLRLGSAAIEEVLTTHPSVCRAVVAPVRDSRRPSLVAYLVADPDAEPIDVDEVKQLAQSRLPALLVPSHVIVVPELPTTSSGKVNLQALPQPYQAPAGKRPATRPRTALEEIVAGVWQSELGDVVDVEQDFADAGGTSLAAMRIAIRLGRQLDVPVSPTEVLLRRTVAGLAAWLAPLLPDAAPADPGDGPAAAQRPKALSVLDNPSGSNLVWFRRRNEGAPTLYCVHPGGGSAHWYQRLTEHLPDWLDVGAFQHPGLTNPDRAAASMADLAAGYLAELRASRPTGPYHVFAWCGGAPIGWEMARTLVDAGEQVTLILHDPVLQVAEAQVGGGANLRQLAECDDAYERLAVETDPQHIQRLQARIAELLPSIVVEAFHDALDDPDLEEIWPIAVKSWRSQVEARLPYRFGRYGGALHLLACDELAGGVHDSLAGLTLPEYVGHWETLATEVTVHRVSGGNVTSMLPPHVAGLAEVLARVVRPGGSRRGGDGLA